MYILATFSGGSIPLKLAIVPARRLSSVIGNRQRFSAGFDCGRNAGDAGREELDREIRFRGFSDVRGVHVDLPINDSVAGSRKIDMPGFAARLQPKT